jgi:hypothetical protein
MNTVSGGESAKVISGWIFSIGSDISRALHSEVRPRHGLEERANVSKNKIRNAQCLGVADGKTHWAATRHT